MNALPDTTGKPNVADESKGSLQSSFASVIGAAAAAATTNGDTKLSRAQNVETKKTSSPESAKKSTSSNSVHASSAQPVAVASIPLTVVVPVVPQTVAQPVSEMPAQNNAASTDTPVVSKSFLAEAVSTISGTGTLDVTKPASTVALPKIAAAGVQENSNASKVDTAAAETVAAIVPSRDNASTHAAAEISPKISAETVSTAVATAPKVSSEPVYVAPVSATPVEVATAIPSKRVPEVDGIASGSSKGNTKPGNANSGSAAADATFETAISGASVSAVANPNLTKVGAATAIANSNPTEAGAATTISDSNPTKANATSAGVDGGIPLNPAVFRAQMGTPVAIPAAESVPSPIPSETPVVTSSARATDVTIGSKNVISSGVAKQASAGVAPTLPVDSTVATAAPKSSLEPVSAPHVQGSSAVSVPAATTTTESKAAMPTTEADTTGATQPVEASVAAVTPQAETIAVAVPQEFVVQSAVVVQSSASTFKVPDGKIELAGTSNVTSGAMKSRASASDWRLNRNTTTSDDKASSTDTDGAAIATRVVTPEAGAKEVASNIKGVLESATFAQNVQTAQAASQTASAPVISTPAGATQDSGTATNTTLPAPATSTESTQAAHALNSAQLIQSVHGSEMRLGMNSAEFGNISINTSLNHQTLSAQISMDHSALGSALAMHLPAIEEKLGSAYGLQAKVELHATGANSTTSDSSSSESRGDRRSLGGSTGAHTNGLQSTIGALTSSNFTSSSSSTSMAASSSRLDIRI